MERRGSGLVRNEGEAECLRVVEIAQRYYLDPPIQLGATDRGRARRIRARASIMFGTSNAGPPHRGVAGRSPARMAREINARARGLCRLSGHVASGARAHVATTRSTRPEYRIDRYGLDDRFSLRSKRSIKREQMF
jgi:hypothetical protein